MKYALACILMFPCQWAYADGNTAVHVVASAALTTGIYITLSAFTGREKKAKRPSLAAAAAMTLAAGLAKESMDSMARRDRQIDGNDLTANVAGVAAASLLIYTIDF